MRAIFHPPPAQARNLWLLIKGLCSKNILLSSWAGHNRARNRKTTRAVTAVVKGGRKLSKDNYESDRPADETFRENKQTRDGVHSPRRDAGNLSWHRPSLTMLSLWTYAPSWCVRTRTQPA